MSSDVAAEVQRSRFPWPHSGPRNLSFNNKWRSDEIKMSQYS